MPNRTIWTDAGKMLIRGAKFNKVRGRSAFKLPNLISMHYAGKGDEYIQQGGKYGALDTAYRFIEHNQRLFGTEAVWLRVLGESAGWSQIPAGTGMFGSPAQDAGIIDVNSYKALCATQDRPRSLTALNLRVLEELFRMSHTTGCVFEYVCDATLKHTEGLCTGVIDHHIRLTAVECRRLQAIYEKAAVVISARNEWDAHNETGTTLVQVNQWAARFYRWKHADGSTKRAFDSPGEGWEAEQWPEGLILVDHGGKDLFDYSCGPEPEFFKLGAVHPLRKGVGWHKRSAWWSVTPEWMADLRNLSRGQPIAFTESMYCVSKPGTESWYRNANGWNDNLNDQMVFVAGCDLPHGPDVFVVHDDIGVQADADWNRGTEWESRLAEFYGGKVNGETQPPPPPDPPPTETKLRIVRDDEKEFVVERDPEVVKGGDEAFVLKETLTHVFLKGRHILQVHCFHGLDRGDIVEMDTEIHIDGRTAYVRSMHKEAPANFDAWDTWESDGGWNMDRALEITVVCRVNGKNETLDQEAINKHRESNRLTARPHFGIRFVFD